MTISKSWFSYLTRAFALSLCTALLLSFVSCSYSTTSQEPEVKIILDANGGSFSGTTEMTKTLLIKKNQTTTLPTADELGLSCSNHNFTGWAKSQQGTVEYNDGVDITSSTDLTLYAQWHSQTGFNLTLLAGGDVAITTDGNTFTATPSVSGTYTYTWYINEEQQACTTNTFTPDTTGMAPGYYTLVVTAVSDSIQSTSSYQITILGE